MAGLVAYPQRVPPAPVLPAGHPLRASRATPQPGALWMRTKGEVEVIGAGFGVPRATAYRYCDEGIQVLAAQAPDLHEALQEVVEQGWSHVVGDGSLIPPNRCSEITESVKGERVNAAWYSGQHPAPGGNVQAVIRPDGVPIAVSQVAPRHQHDRAHP